MISYESLNTKLQKEISRYHDEKVKNGFARNLETSTKEWFHERFENWLKDNKYVEVDTNRKNMRINVELPVTIAETLIDSTHASKQDEQLLGMVTNISRGGIFFTSDKKYEVSSVLKLRINFSQIDSDYPEVDALALVVRCEPVSDQAYGIGVAFSSLYDDNSETISMFIFKQMIAYIANS